MKYLMIILLLIPMLGHGQNPGTGGSQAGITCDVLASEVRILLKTYNKSRGDSPKAKSFKEFVAIVSNLAISTKFKMLEKYDLGELKKRCGEENFKEIQNKNPWITNEKISSQLKIITQIIKNDQCPIYNNDVSELTHYLEFLQLWHQKKKSDDNLEFEDNFMDNGPNLIQYGG